MNTTLAPPAGFSALGSRADRAPRSRAFWAVMACFLVHGLVVSTWVSRIASIKTALRLGDGALGLALLGTAIGSVTAIPICGSLVARYGSRRAAQWTAAGFCLALIPIAFARDGNTLFAALLFYGAMAGANDVAMNAHAVAIEKLLGTPTMSRFHSMFSIGGIAGAGLGAVIAGRGVPPAAHLVAAAAIILTFALLMGRRLLETRNGAAHNGAARGETAQVPPLPSPLASGAASSLPLASGAASSLPLTSDAASTPPLASGAAHAVRASLRRVPATLIALSAIGFCIFLSEGAIADWTAVYLKQILGAGEGLAPVGYAVFSAAMAIFRFTGDAITLRLGRARVIRYGGVIAAAGLTFALLVPSPYWAMAGFAAVGAGFSSIIPLVFAAGGRIPQFSEGAGVATVSGLGYLGFLVGPPAIGFLSELTSLRVGLFLLVALSLTAASLVGVVERSASNPLAD